MASPPAGPRTAGSASSPSPPRHIESLSDLILANGMRTDGPTPADVATSPTSQVRPQPRPQQHLPGAQPRRTSPATPPRSSWIGFWNRSRSTRRNPAPKLYRTASSPHPPPSRRSSAASVASVFGRSHLTRRQLFVLTLSLAGAQIAWSLEFAYGTPFLLSLGLSKEATALVWLAGPLSGLAAQPIIGALSDRSTSRFRRRSFMIGTTAFLVLGTLALAYVQPMARFLVDLLGTGLGDWDPEREAAVARVTQLVAVASFWLLDFALNGLQAAARALILDVAPSAQQSHANAWHGRMTHAGNVVGYAAGWLDLSRWRGLAWLGGGQFRKFSLVSLVSVVVCVGITCAGTSEHESPNAANQPQAAPAAGPSPTLTQVTRETLGSIWTAIRRLPRPVRRICLVQLFAFMGWFPFLFYATTYVVETYVGRGLSQPLRVEASPGAVTTVRDEGQDHAMERGSFAMLLFALVALIAGTLLPYTALSSESRVGTIRLNETAEDDTEVDEEDTVEEVRANPDLEPGRNGHRAVDELLSGSTVRRRDEGKPPSLWPVPRSWVRAFREGFTLRTLWTLASLLFALLMWATLFTQGDDRLTTANVALVGIPWAVASWAPYALVMEHVREAEEGSSPFEFDGDFWGPRRTAERRHRQRRARERSESSADAAAAHVGDDGSPRRRVEAAVVDCAPLGGTTGRADKDDARNDTRGALRAVLTRGSAEAAVDGGGVGVGTVAHRGGALGGDADDGQRPEAHRRSSFVAHETQTGGTVLGIHNLAIVLPQFVVSIVSSVLFRFADGGHGGSGTGVAWVLRFGGTMSLVAALLTRAVPLTRTEREKRGLLVHVPHFDDEASEFEGEEEEDY